MKGGSSWAPPRFSFACLVLALALLPALTCAFEVLEGTVRVLMQDHLDTKEVGTLAALYYGCYISVLFVAS